MKKVDFLIVGAAKSGTTSIYNYLIQHPEIYMPECKEPHFFVKNSIKNKINNFIDKEDEYFKLFNHPELIQGEASVFYLYYYEEAIENIKKYLGTETKIIIVLRNPTERAFSAYRYVKKSGKEFHSFSESIELEKMRINKNLTPMMHYVGCSKYSNQVKEYINNFDNVHCIIFEEFLSQKKDSLKKLCQFLNIDDRFAFDTKTVYNANDTDWKYNTKYIKLFTTDNNFKKAIKKIFKNFPFLFSYIQKIYRSLFMSKTKAKLLKKDQDRLKLIFDDDIRELEFLLNKDLSIWR